MPRTFAIGDAVVHIRGSPVGVVISRHPNGLISVKWESRVIEKVPPEELRVLRKSA